MMYTFLKRQNQLFHKLAANAMTCIILLCGPPRLTTCFGKAKLYNIPMKSIVSSRLMCTVSPNTVALVAKDPIKPNFVASPVTMHTVFGKTVHIKRDDAIDFMGMSGNKARKLYNLAIKEPFPKHVVSFGGPQSNMMHAIAQLAKRKAANFTYLTKKVPKFLKDSPSGNYESAIEAGMRLVELTAEEYKQLTTGDEEKILMQLQIDSDEMAFIPQGAAYADARVGLSLLAAEIAEYTATVGGPWKVIVESGTGTSALFLSEELIRFHNIDIQVVAVPCVGSANYLREQMTALALQSEHLPKILDTNIDTGGEGYIFGKPYRRYFTLWNKLRRDTCDSFDLIYAPRAWELLLKNFESEKDFWKTANVMYYHCGAELSNGSQLNRYRYYGLDESNC